MAIEPFDDYDISSHCFAGGFACAATPALQNRNSKKNKRPLFYTDPSFCWLAADLDLPPSFLHTECKCKAGSRSSEYSVLIEYDNVEDKKQISPPTMME